MDDLFRATPAWHAAYRLNGAPGAVAGILALRGVANPPSHPAIERAKAALEADLRARFGELDRAGLRAVAALPAYAAYYKRFGQRYHVALQLESVAQKGKGLPRVAALVEAMFVAELRNLILTAGHDLDALAPPIRLDVGTGAERYTSLAGNETTVKPGDMYMADARGVLSAIITGPAGDGRLTATTTAALFAVYAPLGVPADLVETHLADLETTVRLISPAAATFARQVVVAGS